jgi:hypothetical protein
MGTAAARTKHPTLLPPLNQQLFSLLLHYLLCSINSILLTTTGSKKEYMKALL